MTSNQPFGFFRRINRRTIFIFACFALIATLGWLAFYPAPQDEPVVEIRTQAPSSPLETGAPQSAVAVATSAPAAAPHEKSPSCSAGCSSHAHPIAAPAAQAAPPSKRAWDYDFLKSLATAAEGNPIRFELTDGVFAAGTIQHLEHVEGALIRVSGNLDAPEAGRFFFQKQTVPGKQGDFAGLVEFPASKSAWRIEPSGPGGRSELVKRRLDEVMCILPAPSAEALAADTLERAPLDPSDVPDDYVPLHNEGIISLQSMPGAPGVLYIDYRGGYTSTWGGINYTKPIVSNAQIKDVWKRVAEDYMPFTINVTTDILVYEAAAQNSRQRCIVTTTRSAAPSAVGVAMLNSWNMTGDTPCWCFITTGKTSAEIIAHEVGHTLSLKHDGRTTPPEDYFVGHGSDTVGWAPIMGGGEYKPVSQWSKGEYASANNAEDDLAKIVTQNNAVDYRPDDTGATQATARYLEVNDDSTVFAEGVIETTGDIDAFRFTTTGGAVSLNANPVGDWANLAIMATLVDSSDTVIATSDVQSQLNASIATNLDAGTYTLRVTGAGRNDPQVDGFSNYASLGYYSLGGTVTNGVPTTRFSIAENSPNGTSVGTVTATSPSPIGYTFTSGNTNGAFAINSSGALTVANVAALNYETLATTTQLTMQYELLINITYANPALNETNRRVAVQVLDVNEAPSITGGAITILEHSIIGSNLLTVTSTDPDHYEYATYSITSGNTGNAFAIDSATGQMTVAADIDIPANTVYNLTVTVADRGTPALTASVVVPVTVVNIPDGYNPGRIVRTYFENITGSAVSDLTNNTRFPDTPDGEQYLTAFDGLTHGDNFGSTIRGYLIPPVTGTYQFWIASDGASELRLSTGTSPANASAIASVSGSTSPYNWTANASQQSVTRTLTAGLPYYIEARHKEGTGDDHVAVAWTGPGISRQVIPGLYLAPFYQNYAPKPFAYPFSIRENAVPGRVVGGVGSIDVNAQDTSSGYVITDGNPDGIFLLNATTGQLTVVEPGLLNASTAPSYTLTIQCTDNGSPPLSGSGTVTVNITSATLTTGWIPQLIWMNVTGSTVEDLTTNSNYPHNNNYVSYLDFGPGGFIGVQNYGDNYGSRIRLKFVPPTTDSYTFYIASDGNSSLLFSPNINGSGATQIAYVNGQTPNQNWTTYPSQTSTVQNLTAGQEVYLETLHKEVTGSDHLSVAYTNSSVTTPIVIPLNLLRRFDTNLAPVFSPTSYSYDVTAATATAGMVLGTVTATDPEGRSLFYAFLTGNAQGAFAIDSATGQITVANPAGLSNGALTLQVAAQDSGVSSGPWATATATVVINVTANNTAPAWSSNPVVKPDATGTVAYDQTLADSASDVDGDALTFSKVRGPAWLSVAANGALTGTPGIGTDGLNSFVVRVTDSYGIFTNATLHISVVGATDSTWIQTTAGPFNWGDPANWAEGAVASGTDRPAFFTPNITADQVINLEAAPTIGGITFTDSTTSSHNLTISGNNVLNLSRSSGVPTIDVTQADRTLTISSIVLSNNGLQKAGPGMLALSGANTYIGTTTISEGTLKLQSTAFSTTARNYSITSGAVMEIASGAGTIPTGRTMISGDGTLRISTGVTANGSSSKTLVLSMDAGSTIDIISAGGTILNGTTSSISWPNNQATLNINGGLQIGASGAITADALTGAGSISSTSEITTGTNFTLGIANGSGTYSGKVTAVGTRVISLVKEGTGTQTFSGETTWRGTTTINDGTVHYAKLISLYNGVTTDWTKTKIIVNSGSTIAFNVGGTNEFTTGNVTTLLTDLGGVVNDNGLRAGSTIAFDTTNAGTFTIADTIDNTTGTGGGAVGLRKMGTNTLVLSGPNSYTGLTTVSAGTLLVNGDQSTASGAVSVAANATLGGTGSIGGNVTVAANGKLEFDISTAAESHNSLELASGKTLTFSGASVLTITSSAGAAIGEYTLLTSGNNIVWTTLPSLNVPLGWAATVSISGNNLKLNVSAVTGNDYTITFDSDGGSAVAPINQNYGTSVTAPANPTKTGYTFAGWSPTVPSTMPNSNTTCVAQWTANSYTITFDSVGGSSVGPITQDFGTDVTAPANPTRTGYTFAGWSPTVPATMPASNTPCIAQWTINTYPVTYDGNSNSGGTAPAAQSKLHDTNLTLQTNSGNLVKTGFSFVGWNTDTNGSGTNYAAGSTYTANAPLTLYAKWIPEGSGTWIPTTAGPHSWGDTANWVSDIVASGVNNTASFISNLTADQIANLNTARAIGNITFTDNTTPSNNLTISGATLTLDLTSGVPSINVTQSDRTLTISSVVAGADGLEKTGSGMLTLSGANTYTGTTTVSAGTLRLQGAAPLNTARTYSIASGAVLNLNGGATFNTAPTVANTTINGTGTLRLSGGSYTRSNSGGGTLTLALGAGGLIDIQSGASAYTWYTSVVSFTGNQATLNLDGTIGGNNGMTINAAALTGTGTINNSVTTTLNIGANNGSGTFSGAIQSSALLTKSGTGTQTLSGTNTYTGTTTISGGTLQFAKANSLLSTSWTKTKVTVNSGGTIAFNVGGTNEFTTDNITTLLTELGGTVTNNGLRAGSTIAFDTTNASGGTFTIANTIANTTSTGGGAVGLRKLGGNTLVLSNPNSYTGATTVSAGTLEVTGSLGATAVSVSTGGTLAGNGNFGGNVTIAAGATHSLAVASTDTSQDTSAITGTLAMAGSTLNLSAASTPAAGIYVLATATVDITGFPTSIIHYNGIHGTVSVDTASTPKRLLLTVTPYDNWASTNATTGTPSDDFDNDGVPNAIEFVLGGDKDTKDLSKLPKAATSGGNMTFTFKRNRNSIGPNVTLKIEVSTDLSTWPDAYIVGATTSDPITVTDNNDGTDTDTITLTLPQNTTKKFVRLKVEVSE